MAIIKTPILGGDGKLAEANLPTRLGQAALNEPGDTVTKRSTLIPIASRGDVYVSGLSNGTDTSTTYRTIHKAVHDITDLTLVYGNFYNNTGLEAAGPNDISVKFTVQASADTYRLKGSFNGKRTYVIEPGTRATSDPIALDIKAGETFYVYTYVSVASAGMKWPVGIQTNSPDGEGRIAGADYTDAGTVTATAVFAYSPLQLLGRPPAAKTVSVGGIGDSIVAGNGDGNTGGFWHRGLSGNISEQRVAYPSEQAYAYNLRTYSQYRSPLLRAATHIVCELGINDVKGNQTLAALQGNLIPLWQKAARRAAKVYQTTLTPVSTSTDTWATVGNQTPGPNEAVRAGFNNWLRAGAPIDSTTSAGVAAGTGGALTAGMPGHPLAGYIELADAVESARNSGIWKAAHTGDGTHPNVTGHTALAAVFTPALFT